MDIKLILLIMLGLFFVLNGINHLFNSHILEEYAEKRGLFSPKIAVLLSGILLIFGGISLVIKPIRIYGIIGLSIFLVVAAFTIHQFWQERDREKRMMEAAHFAKNMAILTELVYIATVS